jgi:presenilin-like A22 family membrane protease
VTEFAFPLGLLGAVLAIATSVALIVPLVRRKHRRWRSLLALDAAGLLMVVGAIALFAASFGPGCNTYTC